MGQQAQIAKQDVVAGTVIANAVKNEDGDVNLNLDYPQQLIEDATQNQMFMNEVGELVLKRATELSDPVEVELALIQAFTEVLSAYDPRFIISEPQTVEVIVKETD